MVELPEEMRVCLLCKHAKWKQELALHSETWHLNVYIPVLWCTKKNKKVEATQPACEHFQPPTTIAKTPRGQLPLKIC